MHRSEASNVTRLSVDERSNDDDTLVHPCVADCVLGVGDASDDDREPIGALIRRRDRRLDSAFTVLLAHLLLCAQRRGVALPDEQAEKLAAATATTTIPRDHFAVGPEFRNNFNSDEFPARSRTTRQDAEKDGREPANAGCRVIEAPRVGSAQSLHNEWSKSTLRRSLRTVRPLVDPMTTTLIGNGRPNRSPSRTDCHHQRKFADVFVKIHSGLPLPTAGCEHPCSPFRRAHIPSGASL